MIRYYKLNDLLNRRGMKKTDLLDIISSPTLAKLSKGETIKTDVIDRICKKLNCQPADIMEYVPDEKIEKSIVKKVILDTEASSMKDMGKVMAIATKELAGKAEGGVISGIVRKLLS